MKRTATVLPLFLLAAVLAARGEDYAFPAVEASGWTEAPAVRVDARETLGGRLVHGVEMRGEPDGSTNRLWDTTALADGWHEIPAENGSLTASVLSVNEPSIAIEGGRLAADAVWTSNATHVVRHWVVVPSGRTLVITTNSVTKLCPGAGIKVEDGGTLRFAGAEDAEAVVTTWDDDTVGAVVGGSGAELPSFAGPIGGVVKQSASATVSDDTHVRFTFSSGLFPTVSVQDASAKRSDGIARIPVLVSGTARDAAFRVDWRAVDGSAKFGEDYLLASGTLRWNKSSDGTKHVEIPLDPETLRGSNTAFRVELTLHYACNVSRASAEVVVREFDFPEIACSGWSGSAAIRFDGRKGIAGAVAHGLERLGEPDGSTNRLWDTTALADGWQEIVPCTGSETNRLLAVNSPTIAVQGGRLQSNASWTSAQTHLVRHTVVVPSGCTLTVGEDAVVKFLPGTFIKVEDGGKLSVVGAKGHDAIFTAVNDDTAGAVIDCGAYTGQSMAFDGIRLQSNAATFQDNAYIQTRGFTWGAYPYVKFDDTVAFRAGGMAYVPVSIASGTRNQAFSIDWEAVEGTARFGEDYTLASGTIEWTGTSQGTKTLQIPLVADHVVGETTSFKLRIKVCRGCNPSGAGECTVTIREFDKIAFSTATATSEPVRFDSRASLGGRIVHGTELRGEPDGSAATAWNTGALADGWHEIVAGGETAELLSVNVPEIAVEGGRLVADTTWDDSTTHLVRHWVVVPSGRTLTVTEGTVVKICPDAGIKVEDGGKLVVNGRDGADAIFTRVDDPAESEQSGGEEEAGGDPSAALLAHYAFTRANLLEAKVGANARESSGRGTVSYSETARNIVRVEDGDILGGRPGAVSVPAGTGFSVPVPADADGANWALVMDFYLPGQAGEWKTFFSLSQANNSDGALFVRQDGQVGQGNYQTFSSLFGAWHQLTVSTTNGTSRYWIDGVQGSLSKNWTLTPGGWLHIAFDNDGEDGEMVLGQVRLYGEATPAGLFSGGGVPVVLAPDPDDGTPVVAIAALKSSVSGGTRLAVRLSDAGGTSCVLRALVSGSDGTSRTVELASASAAGRYEYDLGALLELLPGEVYSVVVEAKNVSAGKTARTSPRSVLVPVPSAGIDWTELDGGTPGGIVILTGGTFQDNGWYQLRGVTCNASNIGAIEIHDAEVSRKTGMAHVAVTVSGNTRNQSFTADWEAVPGTATFGNDFKLASGRLTWSKSSEGTKWIQIPINKKTEAGARRTFRVRLKTVRGMTGSGAEATIEVREYDEGSLDADEVAFFPEGEGSNEFSVDEPVWKEPIFRHETEPIRLSGAWQGLADPAETTVRLSWEGENGSGVLAEVPGGEPATYEWRAEDWEVGSYVLRHDVLDASGKRLATYEKTFAVPSWDGVELHGGTLTSNETWRAGIVHVVYETVYVPALYTILLEPGAIVKFLTGTGITIEAGGGALFANGVVFTHINDDTVGGDTLNDGNTLVPVEDAYEFKGELTIGDESELRYKTQAPLSGTISGSRKLTRGSTYRVSGNVTIASGSTLVIPAGTILKFDAGVQMTVNSGGTLLSEGTRAAPVVFTSVKDDEFGGDTNGDGDATIPAPGDWTAVKVAGGRAEFHNTKILYSSRNQTTGAINQNGGTVVFDGGEIAHGLYDAVGVESGNFFMTNAVIRDCLLAFRHWARDPIVNCVIHDCGRLTQGGGQTFVNCVFADIDETWEAFGFPKSTYRNCVFWNEGGSVLTGEGTQDAMTVCGQDGNRWGDPMFRDADAGDYRIREGSACIDAADSSAAPEKDTFGQKRWDFPAIANADAGAADVGVAECVPRNAASDVDLVPVSAKMSWNRAAVKPGDAPYFFWTVANDGGEDVETDWWDELALVSVSSGRIAVLGEYNQTKGVSAGGTTTGSKYFEIPPLAEGDYRLRLNANSHRSDVPEGSRTENNVLLSDTVVHVEVATEDASVGAAGMAGKGGRIVRKFEVAAGSGAMLAHVTAPAGSVLRYGLGFMPGEGSASGELELDASGRAAFAVPEGADCVYVVLESAADGPFDIVFTDGSLAVTSVQPAQVPRNGRVTLRIAGAGFADGCAVSLLAPSGAAVVPVRTVRSSAEELWATVDCAALAAAGTRFALRVETSGGDAMLENAVSVTGEEGHSGLWAELDRSDLEMTRRGARITARIHYGNTNNVDILAPILQVAVDGGGELGYIDGRRGFSAIQFVGAGGSGVAGVLRPGEERTIKFHFWAGESGSIYLYTSDGQTWFEAPWTSLDAMLADFSSAATRIALRGQDATDYELVHDLALAVKNGEPTSVICGRVVDEEGKGICETQVLLTNNLATISCLTDHAGWFCTAALAEGHYIVLLAEFDSFEGPSSFTIDGQTDDCKDFRVTSSECLTVSVSGIGNHISTLRLYSAEGDARGRAPYSEIGNVYRFRGADPGIYSVECLLDDGTRKNESVWIEGGSVASLSFDFSEKGGIHMVFDGSDTTSASFLLFDGPDLERIVDLYGDSEHSIDGLPSGNYTILYHVAGEESMSAIPFSVSGGGVVEIDVPASLSAGAAQEFAPCLQTSLMPSTDFSFSLGISNAETTRPDRRVLEASDGVEQYARKLLDISIPTPSSDRTCADNQKRKNRKVESRAKLEKELSRYDSVLRWHGNYMVGKDMMWDGVKDLGEEVGWALVGKLVTDKLKGGAKLVAATVLFTVQMPRDMYKAFKSGQADMKTAIEYTADVWEVVVRDLQAAGELTLDAAAKLTFVNELITAYKIGEAGGKIAAGVAVQVDANAKKQQAIESLWAASRDYEAILNEEYPLCCPGEEAAVSNPSNWVDKVTPSIPQSVDPNEVAGPLGLGDPETERFVKPGEWLDFTIYFENATNATAAARTVKIVEDVDPRLDWDSLTLGEVVFANETDRGLVGLSEGASDYEVPGTNYLVRTTFTVHNGLASWYLRLVDPAGDEDGWPTDKWLANYGGFLPPNDTNHVGEGHVTYRIKVRDDAPKNVRIETSAKITFDSHETIPTDPSWWNTVGHPAVELAFFRNCDDAVLSMPTNGPYACDAPEFGTPVREGWFFLGWADTNGVARNCGADLPYDTDALDLYAQWKEIVEAKFATIAVDGGVLIAGLADGEACPEDLVIPSTLEIGGRRVKVVGVADDAFKGKRAIRTLTVMEGVRTIGARSFMNCTSLESVSLPSSVESIGENAFYGCRLLGSLTIAAETPPALGSGAFRSVAAAGVLRVPEGNETAYAAWIGTDLGSAWTVDGYDPGEPPEPGEPVWTLYADQNRLVYAAGAADVRWTIDVSVATDGGVTLLRASTTDERGAALVLPDPVLDETGAEHRIVAIGADGDITLEGVFEGLDLGSVSIPESVVSIAPCAFANCAELEDIVFAGDAPALRTVGAGAFFGCTSLRRVWMDVLFDLAELGGADDPLGVFESCWNLSDVVLPCYVDSVGAFAFQDCSRLASVTFDGFDGARIRSIGKRAFYNCDSLADVNWDALVGLEEVGEAAFGGDTAATAPKIVSATFHRDFASLGAGALLNAGSLAEITCFAETPPARGANAFLGVARTGVLRVPAAVAEDYTNQTARAWIGPEEGKLPPWNGTSGWSVEYLDASEELRRREAHLTDEAFAGFLALADLLGFTESELCGVDHPAEALRPDLRIVAFDRDATTFPVSIRFENGIDKTSKTAFTRLRGKSGQNIYALVSDELGGAETPVALQGTLDSDGTFRVYLGTAFDKTAPSQFVRIVILDE